MKLLLLSTLTLFLIGCSTGVVTTIEKSEINHSTILFSNNSLDPEKEKNPLVLTIELDAIFYSSRPNTGMKDDTTETFRITINLLNQSARKITYTDHTCSFTDNFTANESSDFYIVKAICFSNAIMPVSLRPNETESYSILLQRKKTAVEKKNKVSLSFNYNEEYDHNRIKNHIVWSNEIDL